jgi:hypothetical protein
VLAVWVLLGGVDDGTGKPIDLGWSAPADEGVPRAFSSDVLEDDAWEITSAYVLGPGLRGMVGACSAQAALCCVVAGVGAPGFNMEVVCCPATGPFNLCSGSIDQPSGIITPGGRSGLPAWMGSVSPRAPWRCRCGVGGGIGGHGPGIPACIFGADGSDAPARKLRSRASSACKSRTS